jgi:hypothetical protein
MGSFHTYRGKLTSESLCRRDNGGEEMSEVAVDGGSSSDFRKMTKFLIYITSAFGQKSFTNIKNRITIYSPCQQRQDGGAAANISRIPISNIISVILFKATITAKRPRCQIKDRVSLSFALRYRAGAE